MKQQKMQYRADNALDISYRKAGIEPGKSGGPKTLDAESRSVKVIAATETPVSIYDWDHGRVDEILLMSGAQIPKSKQIPLLNAHSRYDVSDVIGSARNLEVRGRKIYADVYFSEATKEAEQAFQLVSEGHITDFSIGYKVLERQYIPEKEKMEISGKTYRGPAIIGTKWSLHELSEVPIGADQNATARSKTDDKRADTALENDNSKKRKMKMNKKLRALLEARGMQKGLTDEEAQEWMQKNFHVLEVKQEEKVIDLSEEQKTRERAAAAQEERTRCMEIRGIARECNLGDEFEQKMIDDGLKIEEVQKRALDKIRENAKTGEGVGHRGPAMIPDGGDERDKFRSAGTDAILMKIGHAPETPAAGADELRGFSLKELARESLRIAGKPVGGSVHKMVGRAFGNSDFPLLINNVLHNSLMRGFDTAMEQWNICFDTGTVTDFKDHYVGRASETNDLNEMAPGEEYTYGKMTEHRETYKVAKYGGMDAVYRETIIDDNLRFLNQIPMKHGEAAARKIGDVAWAAMITNPNMGDGTALFHADHNNLASVVGPPGVSTLNEGNEAMRLQKDLRDLRRLNIIPRFIVAPVNLQGDSEIFFGSANFSDNDTAATDSTFASTRRNIWGGSRLAQIYEPRLDDNSTTAWYLLGARGTTVTVFFLEGEERPFMDSRQGWTVDGIEYKVRIQAGAKAMAWESMYKNAGA